LKRVYALLLAAVVASASAASGYLIYRSLGIPPSRLRPFTCVFVTLLEDEHGNTLGKLRGEFILRESVNRVLHAVCNLSLSTTQGEPSIEEVEVRVSWVCIIYEGPTGTPVDPRVIKTTEVVIHPGKRVTVFKRTYDMSELRGEANLLAFLRFESVRIEFSDGSTWLWNYEYDVPSPQGFGYDCKLRRISGRIEGATAILTVKLE